MLPRQGDWTVSEYQALNLEGPLIELNEGCLEVLPMPDWMHQAIAAILYERLKALVIDGRPGLASLPPFNLNTIGKQYRHPDVMYLAPANRKRFRREYWDYADFVAEVVSGDKRDQDRDKIEKRAEYAQAGVREYWIIDPELKQLIQLVLDPGATEYREIGVFGPAEIVRAATLPGFEIDFGALLTEAEGPPVEETQ